MSYVDIIFILLFIKLYFSSASSTNTSTEETETDTTLTNDVGYNGNGTQLQINAYLRGVNQYGTLCYGCLQRGHWKDDCPNR